VLDRLQGDDDWSIERTFCDTSTDPPNEQTVEATFQSLNEAFLALSQELAALRLQFGVCEIEPLDNVQPTVIGQATSSESRTVEYIEISPLVRQVELIITGSIPTPFRLYRSDADGEQQGKFGNLTIAYQGTTGGFAPDAFQQWAWTRRTILNCGEPLRSPRYVRVFVQPGLSWVLYDTGLRN
jgi:hypothetical protein